jgi:hypothetical protein
MENVNVAGHAPGDHPAADAKDHVEQGHTDQGHADQGHAGQGHVPAGGDAQKNDAQGQAGAGKAAQAAAGQQNGKKQEKSQANDDAQQTAPEKPAAAPVALQIGWTMAVLFGQDRIGSAQQSNRLPTEHELPQDQRIGLELKRANALLAQLKKLLPEPGSFGLDDIGAVTSGDTNLQATNLALLTWLACAERESSLAYQLGRSLRDTANAPLRLVADTGIDAACQAVATGQHAAGQPQRTDVVQAVAEQIAAGQHHALPASRAGEIAQRAVAIAAELSAAAQPAAGAVANPPAGAAGQAAGAGAGVLGQAAGAGAPGQAGAPGNAPGAAGWSLSADERTGLERAWREYAEMDAVCSQLGRSRVAKLQEWLATLDSGLTKGTSAIVSASIGRWCDLVTTIYDPDTPGRLRGSKLPLAPTPQNMAASRVPTRYRSGLEVAGELYDSLLTQGDAWLNLLTGLESTDRLLTPEGYVAAGEAALGRSARILRRIAVHYWFALVLLAAALGWIIYFAVTDLSGASKVWTQIAAVASALGITAKGIGNRAAKLSKDAGTSVFSAEETDAMAWAITCIPAGLKLDRPGVKALRSSGITASGPLGRV